MIILLMCLLGLTAMAIPGVLLATKRIRIQRDFFFLCIYAQILIYLHIAPSVNVMRFSDDDRFTYCWFQFVVIGLFEIPFAWIYVVARRRRGPVIQPRIQVRSFRIMFLAIASVGLGLLFLFIAARNDILFRWLGPAYPIVMARLPRLEFYIFRFFIQTAPFAITVLLLSLYFGQRQATQKLTGICLAIVGAIYMVQSMINSRLESGLMIATVAGIVFMRQRSWRLNRSAVGLVAAVLLSAYTARVALTVRNNYQAHGLRWEFFIPFSEGFQRQADPWEARLDGIDFMSVMSDSLSRDGYAWGRAWIDPLYITFGEVLGAPDVAWMKQRFMVDAKYYLLRNYTNIENPTMDYGAGMLNDLFGNFGYIGMIMGAPILALPCAFVSRQMEKPTSVLALLVAVAVLQTILPFEHETIFYFLKFVKLAPMLLLFCLLQPFRIKPWSVGETATL